jgi:hypothetical protein
LGRRSDSAGSERAETAPPATRDKPLATRLTTLLFHFCSYPASRREESISRLDSG